MPGPSFGELPGIARAVHSHRRRKARCFASAIERRGATQMRHRFERHTNPRRFRPGAAYYVAFQRNGAGGNNYDPNTHTVYWDPTSSVKTIPGGKCRTPARKTSRVVFSHPAVRPGASISR